MFGRVSLIKELSYVQGHVQQYSMRDQQTTKYTQCTMDACNGVCQHPMHIRNGISSTDILADRRTKVYVIYTGL